MKKKVLAAILAATMAMSILAGCGAKEEAPASSDAPVASSSASAAASSEAPSEEAYAPSYPYETDVKLKIYIGGAIGLSTGQTAFEDIPFCKGLVENIGIDVEWMYAPLGSDGTAAYNLMLMEEELPHIVFGYYTNASNMQDLIDDGIALNLNDYFEEYAPAYYATINSGDTYMEKNLRLMKIEDGTVPAFNSFRSSPWGCCYQGIQIRQDWLDELGMEAPTTMAEMEDVLVAFKEKYNAFYSTNLQRIGFAFGSAMDAMGTIHGHYIEDDTVKAHVEAPGLKDLITKMNDWYKAGLLDPNWATADNAYWAQMSMDNKMGATVNAISQQTKWLKEAEAAGVVRDWKGIPSLTNEAGDTVHWIQTEYSTFTGSFGAYVTSACDTEEELKAAMAWVDWAYTEEGQMYWNFGTEGVSYEMVDGKPQFSDLLWNDQRGIEQALKDYTAASSMPVGIQLEEFVRAKNSSKAGESVDAWTSNQDAADYIVPGMSYPDDVRQQNADINTALSTYVSEQLTKMIMGEVSIDTWGDFIAQCKSLGLDTQTANIQAAYDEFIK